MAPALPHLVHEAAHGIPAPQGVAERAALTMLRTCAPPAGTV
ncbi:hypothetical protein ACW69C_18560 [Streptomyces sp. MN3]